MADTKPDAADSSSASTEAKVSAPANLTASAPSEAPGSPAASPAPQSSLVAQVPPAGSLTPNLAPEAPVPATASLAPHVSPVVSSTAENVLVSDENPTKPSALPEDSRVTFTETDIDIMNEFLAKVKIASKPATKPVTKPGSDKAPKIEESHTFKHLADWFKRGATIWAENEEKIIRSREIDRINQGTSI
jgi:hypothetical protein